MAAESNTPNDIEIWIVKVFESCTNVNQIAKARRLIDFYEAKIEAEGTLNYRIQGHIRGKLIQQYKSIKSGLIKQGKFYSK